MFRARNLHFQGVHVGFGILALRCSASPDQQIHERLNDFREGDDIAVSGTDVLVIPLSQISEVS